MKFRNTVPNSELEREAGLEPRLPLPPDYDWQKVCSLSAQLASEAAERRSSTASPPAPAVFSSRAVYSSDYNSLAQTPPGDNAGVESVLGRLWAEGRGLQNSALGGGFTLTMTASQNGVRCAVECAAGVTLTDGSIRFWVQDRQSLEWSLTPVEVVLPTGAQRVSTGDQFITVGAR